MNILNEVICYHLRPKIYIVMFVYLDDGMNKVEAATTSNPPGATVYNGEYTSNTSEVILYFHGINKHH